MPSNNHQETVSVQVKTCATCHSVLLDSAASVFLAERDTIVCIACSSLRDYRPQALISNQLQLRIDLSLDDVPFLTNTRRSRDVFDNHSANPPPPISHSLPHNSCHETSPLFPTYSKKSAPSTPPCPVDRHSNTSRHHDPPLQSSLYQHPAPSHQPTTTSCPDPLTDITRIRIRSRGHHCLYPGAVFQGTQKSGRNSYQVNVTIVDVNFPASTLCGYLRIRGLTDDWPELTTYFDAEIIGTRYGFMTQNWGASQHEDLIHWSRFPAFKHIKNETKRPHMTIDDRDRGAVFMRWKERFLVPDHRVQDINGASFAGFYYVCVDFNPAPPSSSSPTTSSNVRSVSQPTSSTPEKHDSSSCPSNGKPEGRQRSRRDSSARRRGASLAPFTPPIATMSGFYYHQNSEPYQQLSLTHVPERASSSFEFR